MDNLAVTSKLATQHAKPQKGAPTPTEAATEPPAAEAPASFGSLLAAQIALSKPKEAAAVEAVLPDAAELTEDLAEEVDPKLEEVVLTAAADPALAQQPPELRVLPAQVPVVAQANFAEAMARKDAASGKELPPIANGPAKSAAFEHAQALLKNPNVAVQPEPELESFAAVLAGKAEVALPETAAAPVQTAVPQAQGLSPVDKPAAASQPVLTVPQRVGAESWGTGLGDKVVWIVGNQMRGAEIHLNPPALGPLEVRIQISDGQANLSFMTQHASVRDAIEAATPKLREMLGDNGIGMGSMSVNVGSFAQQQPQPEPGSPQASWNAALAEAEFMGEELTVTMQPLRARGMVDFFA